MNAPSKIEAATLASAMAAAFGEIESATKEAENPAFKQGGKAIKYANLTNVIEAIKPALIRHGLYFTQRPEPSENGVTIETVIGHTSGEEMSLGKLFVPANQNNAQGFGSALTYARRYALVTAFGVPVEDDDGNAASHAPARTQGGSGQEHNGGRASSPTGTASPQQVSDADLTKITTLCSTIGGGQAGIILEAYGVADLSRLNRRQAAAVIKRLNEKLEDKIKAETNAKAKEETANV